jgi:DNA-binding GntR family transcriptional regulator
MPSRVEQQSAVEPATAADRAEAALHKAIMDGAYPPGSPLRLRDLTEHLDVSITPIRSALQSLHDLGLVDIVAHKGAWVRPLRLDDLYDTYFMRIHLEARALRLAAGRISEPALANARAALAAFDRALQAGDAEAARDAHERFHFTLYEASGSAWLVRSIRPVWRNSERYRMASMRDELHRVERDAEHHAMVDALQDGDAGLAADLIVEHLTTTCELVAAEVAPDAPAPQSLPTTSDLLW